EAEPGDRVAAGEQSRDGEDCGTQAPSSLYAWIGSLATFLLLGVVLVLERGPSAPLRSAGAALLVLSAAFIFAPFFLLPRHGGSQGGGSYMQARAVVDRGLYGIVRHPQYLGYVLLACGFALLSQHWLALVLAAVGVAAFYRQAIEEEKECLARFGPAYGRYRQRVPRFNALLGLARRLRQGGA
ncbi:MAG: isoprenylcysteine carboxylmethyltransferase family protein, partial [Anaerolineae bacterium]